MAAGMVLSVAQTLFSALQCKEVRELCSMFGYQTKLGNLERTVNMIKAVLLDADSKHQELSAEGRNWVEKLKDAVYDADDLFDELTTKAQQLKSMPGGKLSKKVRRFFSNDNQLRFGIYKTREIKKLREKLNAIAEDRERFGVSDEYKPVKRREETCSYVYETSVIGREDDKDSIVELLCDSSCTNPQNVSFVSIVGMGGLGKTTLAQLVFNDKRIVDTFGKDNLYWVCVSEEFDLEQILCKLLDIKRCEHTLEALQKLVRQKIEGKRYFLVLDDVWEENHYKWLKLEDFLCSGAVGSRILVTTRSNKVAISVRKNVVYELKGLSQEKSWQLFKEIAFGVGDDHDPYLVAIGKDIVRKCSNVPLSIKVTSSLLHGLDKIKWEEYRSRDLASITSCHGEEDPNPIMSTLIFSYYNLTPELKSCFSFCSLFPKDYLMKKELLISLWLAVGFLVPSHEGESMEDVGEEYFWILLQRCFFQDVKRDKYGEICSCKMHDLMHDLALMVAGKESMILTTSRTGDLKNKIRHLSATRNAPIDALFRKCFPSMQKLRTLFMLDWYSSMDAARVALNCRRLRVLYFEWGLLGLLPDEIGKLMHLRYLDVSYSYSFEKLPSSITTLHNLQILKLYECEALIELPNDLGKLVNLRMLDIHGCSKLEELPKDIGKLVNLRILDIRGCFQLKELPESIVELINLRMLKIYKKSDDEGRCEFRYMPKGMDKLRNLHTLTYFVVGGNSSTQVQKGEFVDLKSLNYLRGYLHIVVRRFPSNNMPIAKRGVDILRKARLQFLEISCEYEIDETDDQVDQGEYHKMILEGLNPNNDHLRELTMRGYQGIKFPNWGERNLSFPTKIVRMELIHCTGLKHLSNVSELVCLRYLSLRRMKNLEFIERDAPCDVSRTFFPSLEELIISKADKLKGWWRDVTWKEKEAERGSGCLVDVNGNCIEALPSIPCLRLLKITCCESLKYLPPCPHLKNLNLCKVDEALSLCMKRSIYFRPSQMKGTNPSTSSSSYSDLSSIDPTFFFLEDSIISNDTTFNSLFQKSFLGCVDMGSLFSMKEVIEIREGFQKCLCFVQHLSITECNFHMPAGVIEYLTNLQSLNIQQCPNLQSLKIQWCPNLKSLHIQWCPNLKSLIIQWCPNLEFYAKEMPWKHLASLSSLDLTYLLKLVKLGKGLKYLTSLEYLRIHHCVNLEDLGEYVGSLSSLQSISIVTCPKLKSLPKAVRQLTSLSQLHIYGASSELKERCRKQDGEDWPDIHHIPNLKIT